MDFLTAVTQGVGSYFGAQQATAANEASQRTTGIVLIAIAIMITVVLVIVLTKKN